jgi:type II secretory pathway component GspD/PulD (secretin)
VNFQGAELQKIVALIHRLSGIEIEVPTEVARERITMESKETTTREILSQIEKEKRCKLSVR